MSPVDVAVRRFKHTCYAFLFVVMAVVIADAAFKSIDPTGAEAVLRAAPEPVRSAYIRFVLSTPTGFLRSKGNKVAVLQALQLNQESGRRNIPFDEAQVTELIDPRHGTKLMAEISADECAVFLLASTGDVALVERALEAHAHDLRAARNISDWFSALADRRPDLYAPFASSLARFRQQKFSRFGGL